MSRLLRGTRRVLAIVLVVGATAGLGAGGARPAQTKATLTMYSFTTQQPGLEVLIANYHRVNPDIQVDVTYFATQTVRNQIELVALAAGNAADVLSVSPGCFNPTAVCALAKPGHLAPLENKPWVHWSVPAVTSLDKYGKGLYAFSPQLAPFGIFTNDDLFGRLGLRVPQTFPQLLDLCRKAKSAGTVAIEFENSDIGVANLLTNLAIGTVYGKDKKWASALRAGKVSFEGTPGWHQALQELIDMNATGCFQAGASGTSQASAIAQFAQGKALIMAGNSSTKGLIDAAKPTFRLSHHPFPEGAKPGQTTIQINIQAGFGVNSHASAPNQDAAEAFLDFIARPKQNSLFTKINGGLSQYEFQRGQLPAFMASHAALIAQHRYLVNPLQTWWNPNVLLALQNNEIGLITGQRSVDDVLKAMDAAWREGPF